ncbi:TIGR02281 family clan AA aspartic protease [Thalassoglobus sp.]|uniref:TIGR02281 family clan AA aspartic protease n=1 Tax=Thalassoglobus sp. TaxID=2795869 RepID=UPI003AA869FB
MSMHRFTLTLLFSSLLISALSNSALAASDVEAQLKEKGVRISSSAAILAAEIDFNRQIRDVSKIRRNVVTAERKREDFKKSFGRLDTQITNYNRQLTQLNTQLANVSDVVTNNRLVGAINALEGRLRLAYQQKERLEKLEVEVHAEVSKARDGFVNHIMEMRKLADSLDAQYRNVDRVVASLVRKYNEAEGTNVELAPTSGFQSNLRKLASLEDDVLTAEVPLRRDRNTFWASVTINEDKAIEMVVDSGASLIALPHKDALALGLEPKKSDPEIRLVVADGRTITGRKVNIKTVRIGQFIAKDVECAVLGPEAVNAEPLLGMSFLGNFKFELDAGKSTLAMTDFNASSNPRTRSTTPTVPKSRERQIFPGEELTQLIDMKFRSLKVNGEFIEDGDDLLTKDNESTAIQLSDVVSDFDLQMDGGFAVKGTMYFMIGWDPDTQSGIYLAYDRLVNFGHWWLQEYENGEVLSAHKLLADRRIEKGHLQIAVQNGLLSVNFNDSPIVKDHQLDRYRPGNIIFGTRPNRYAGKVLRLSKITIQETPAERTTDESTPGPEATSYDQAKRQTLFPGKPVTAPKVFPTIGTTSKGEPVIATHALEIDGTQMKSTPKQVNAFEIVNHAENFELTLSGNFAEKGIFYCLVGWNQETSAGYRIDQDQLVKNDAWRVLEMKDGKTLTRTGIGSHRLGSKNEITIRVLNKVLSLEMNGKFFTQKFILENYTPGSIFIGTAPARYGGRTIKLDSITLREL